MLSRKQFLKKMLFQGLRTLNDLSTGGHDRLSEQQEDPGRGFDLPLTELSPSLLAIEAQQRGIQVQPGCADALRRAIYQEMSLKGPNSEACKS